jgi:hypothetical protein
VDLALAKITLLVIKLETLKLEKGGVMSLASVASLF